MTAWVPPSAARLARITDELLDQEDPERLCAAASDLHGLFAGLTGIGRDREDPADSEAAVLTCGIALSPTAAARCVLDVVRTFKFLKGAHAALTATRTRFPGRTLEVLYAGCGPFAPLGIPLATRFDPDQARFTFLDVHARALDCVRRIVGELGLEAHARAYVQADATRYVHSHPLHVVITETMQRALSREPQLAITRNLARQLCPGGVFVPETVTVEAWLVDADREVSVAPGAVDDSVRTYLGPVMELNAGRSASHDTAGGSAPVVFDVPRQAEARRRVMLTTTVTVFDSIRLSEREAGITYPFILHDVPLNVADIRMEFRYREGKEPGFVYRWASRGP